MESFAYRDYLTCDWYSASFSIALRRSLPIASQSLRSASSYEGLFGICRRGRYRCPPRRSITDPTPHINGELNMFCNHFAILHLHLHFSIHPTNLHPCHTPCHPSKRPACAHRASWPSHYSPPGHANLPIGPSPILPRAPARNPYPLPTSPPPPSPPPSLADTQYQNTHLPDAPHPETPRACNRPGSASRLQSASAH